MRIPKPPAHLSHSRYQFIQLHCPGTSRFVQAPLTTRGSIRPASSLSFHPNFFTPLQNRSPRFFQPSLPKMATLDESLINFLKSHAPNNASSEADAVKASQALFPATTYTTAEKAEISQWLTRSNHLASTAEDAAKSAERLSALNTHLSSRTTVLGAKPSVVDIAIYQKLAPVVAKWSVEERTGEQGYHHIVRYLDFVQNSPIYGLKLEDKVNVELDNIIFKIKPIDAKAEKERKKKEKEAAAANAVASGATPTTLTGDQAPEGKKGKEKGKDQLDAAGDAVASAVTGKAGSGAPDGAPTKKKEKKEKQPKPQKA
jgi:aminoacyl tRNA synthase complex-interacting multifunctional protein 1